MEKSGFKILDFNWRCRWGEIDIIARKESMLVFFEVKYRKEARFGYPIQFISPRKIQKLRRAIKMYLLMRTQSDELWRLDGICILGFSGNLKLKHYKNLLADC